mmetsp:Transcript_29687/g.62045  ORF Transcript_29687/g.62045 Transcript_29687/m.62045 type:complete len:124 (+) Transcript_29687:1700-2071(+)
MSILPWLERSMIKWRKSLKNGNATCESFVAGNGPDPTNELFEEYDLTPSLAASARTSRQTPTTEGQESCRGSKMLLQGLSSKTPWKTSLVPCLFSHFMQIFVLLPTPTKLADDEESVCALIRS